MQDAVPLGTNADPEVIAAFLKMAEDHQKTYADNKYHSTAWQLFWFITLLCITYFGFIGFPLWDGIPYALWKWLKFGSHVNMGILIFFLWGASISWLPQLMVKFEKNVEPTDDESAVQRTDAFETCLLIPAYKAAGALPATLEHALKIFKPDQIFVLNNGNSPTPLDNTEEVCRTYGVNHAWIPVGSKIVAEFVGVMLSKKYKYAMLIDDDVHLPANLPIVTERISDTAELRSTVCIGYTIKSTGAGGAKGTMIQQAQDLEYKLSGLSRHFQGTYGSATFPHGAIILWNRDILEKLFWSHPGYKISEDWYFGHTARSAGYRIEFCSQVFVETETPPSLFIPVKSTRGGYGEMTVWKQRFYRWNFFFLYRLRDDLNYLIFAWRLGHYEIITKLFVLCEIVETFIYFSRPFMLPIALWVHPIMAVIMTGALFGVYLLCVLFFNSVHLRYKKEMVAWRVIPVYFAMKLALTLVNTVSVYYSLYAYAKFFANRHPRVTENFAALTAAQSCLEIEAEKQRIIIHEEMMEYREDLGKPAATQRVIIEEEEMEPHQTLAKPAAAMSFR
ncbi:hypothetical protein CC86DRAFT_295068 [Ophiobolus disseminans]|uniref:Glycosyltransferase family 2 protein n=1 Tax=Ophiobolus disseminans TaxID=1469910 RepID=A0A6A6ZXT2_9PLEO|nr:hypothetical protein CC86DRAFT_295068 [Ophiobolus disseminans]